jgi:biotin carboxyl carrier protein
VILHVEVAGRDMTVEVQRDEGVYVATVDGRRHVVDVCHVGGSWSLLIGTRSYDVSFANESGGALTVVVDDRRVPVVVELPGRSWSSTRPGGAPGGATAGPHRIVAPMPGKIVKVLVKPGDEVLPRQGLVVVEAMKMENELRSQLAGTVSEVRVTEGASVETGTILVIVE